MGGLSSNFGPFRAVPQSRDSLATRTLSDSHVDDVDAPRHRRDGHVTLKFLLTDSPQVALDDLDVIIPSHKLNVHGPTDVEGFRDLGRGALHLLLRLHI